MRASPERATDAGRMRPWVRHPGTNAASAINRHTPAIHWWKDSFARNSSPSIGKSPMTNGIAAQWIAQATDAKMPKLSLEGNHLFPMVLDGPTKGRPRSLGFKGCSGIVDSLMRCMSLSEVIDFLEGPQWDFRRGSAGALTSLTRLHYIIPGGSPTVFQR